MRTLQELVSTFSKAVLDQDAAIEACDPKRGNRHAKIYIRAFEKLRERGDEGREALATLLASTEASVRTTAAAFLLRYKHADAKRVLETAARGKGLNAFAAAETLKRWQEGTWQLDVEGSQRPVGAGERRDRGESK